MKKIFTLLFALSFAILGTAQIPKGSTTIKVEGVSFNQVLNALLEAGYFIEMKDAELQIAKTSPQSLFKGTFFIYNPGTGERFHTFSLRADQNRIGSQRQCIFTNSV